MATSPRWKIYGGDGKYEGCVKESIAAASLVALYGDGATVRWGHPKRNIVWTEGHEDIWAGESYDIAAEQMRARAMALGRKRKKK